MLKKYLFDGSALGWIKQRFERVVQKLELSPTKVETNFTRDFLLKVKARYRSIKLEKHEAQVEAFTSLMAREDTIAFLTAEQKALSKRIIRPRKRQELVTRLGAIATEAAMKKGSGSILVQEPGALTDADFLDFVHVNKRGYEIYAADICEAVKAKFMGS